MGRANWCDTTNGTPDQFCANDLQETQRVDQDRVPVDRTLIIGKICTFQSKIGQLSKLVVLDPLVMVAKC